MFFNKKQKGEAMPHQWGSVDAEYIFSSWRKIFSNAWNAPVIRVAKHQGIDVRELLYTWVKDGAGKRTALCFCCPFCGVKLVHHDVLWGKSVLCKTCNAVLSVSVNWEKKTYSMYGARCLPQGWTLHKDEIIETDAASFEG